MTRRYSSGGAFFDTLKRATGYGPSKKDHEKLIRKMKEKILEKEKELKHKEKHEAKIKEDIFVIKTEIDQFNEQIKKSEKVVKSILGGTRKSRKSRTSKRKTAKVLL